MKYLLMCLILIVQACSPLPEILDMMYPDEPKPDNPKIVCKKYCNNKARRCINVCEEIKK